MVHNHDYNPACKELKLADGSLVGACLLNSGFANPVEIAREIEQEAERQSFAKKLAKMLGLDD